jgi:hypothetical protein
VSIRRTVPPIPVERAEHSDWRESITMYNRYAALRDWEWAGPDVPRVKTPIRDLHVDADGRIWVLLSQPARLDTSVSIPVRPADAYRVAARYRWIEPLVFDVFDSDRRYVGQVRFPEAIGKKVVPPSQFAIQGDIVWAVVHDQDDVPQVKRYRIAWNR